VSEQELDARLDEVPYVDADVDAVMLAADDHCAHHTHDDRCGGYYTGCTDEPDDEYCVHCECCCTCLGCEYGPRDGLLMFPQPTEDGVRIR